MRGAGSTAPAIRNADYLHSNNESPSLRFLYYQHCMLRRTDLSSVGSVEPAAPRNLYAPFTILLRNFYEVLDVIGYTANKFEPSAARSILRQIHTLAKLLFGG